MLTPSTQLAAGARSIFSALASPPGYSGRGKTSPLPHRLWRASIRRNPEAGEALQEGGQPSPMIIAGGRRCDRPSKPMDNTILICRWRKRDAVYVKRPHELRPAMTQELGFTPGRLLGFNLPVAFEDSATLLRAHVRFHGR